MDTFTLLAALLALIALDVTAVLLGSDSREPPTDDHQR